jgi:membrane protein DedA with SNARE-associated domain
VVAAVSEEPQLGIWILVTVVVLAVTGTILFWRKTGPAVRLPLSGLSLLAGIAAVIVGLLISYLIGGLLGLAAVYLGNSERRQARAMGVHWAPHRGDRPRRGGHRHVRDRPLRHLA